jgi:1,4-alpha-glucan branching enzyme
MPVHTVSPITQLEEHKQQLESFLAALQKQDTQHAGLKKIFYSLPQEMRNLLYHYHWIESGAKKGDHSSELSLNRDFRSLLSIMLPLRHPSGGNIVEQCIRYYQDRILQNAASVEEKNQYIQTMEKECFGKLLTTPSLDHRQLKACFKQLSKEVQSQVQKPPYFTHGVHSSLYETLGAHLTSTGADFSVYAPQAKAVTLILTTADQSLEHPLTRSDEGVWKGSIKGVLEGQTYFYRIEDQSGDVVRKIDPFAIQTQMDASRPGYREAVVTQHTAYPWHDAQWMKNRQDTAAKPLNVYEVHPSSWRTKENRCYTFRDLADESDGLVNYCAQMGYTHVELMGILDHPAELSWGYQPTSFFAPNPRLGTLEDLKYLIDQFHQKGIAVILDWIPGHFATDDFSLSNFDGTPLFEPQDAATANIEGWGVKTFDCEKRFTRNFLISSACYWGKEVHVDALRMDAITSLLNTDPHMRLPLRNHRGGYTNLHALYFLRQLNNTLQEQIPGLMTIAEESSGFPMLTKPTTEKRKNTGEKEDQHRDPANFGKQFRGLGFTRKWAMGYMHDILRFMEEGHHQRSYHHNLLTFTVEAADCDEQVILPFSHDEGAHGKKTMRMKMPGSIEIQCAGLRALFGYQMTRPGGMLTFMGDDFGQSEEWSGRLKRNIEQAQSSVSSVQWEELNPSINIFNYPHQKKLLDFMSARNLFYKEHPALWENDRGFQWINGFDATNNLISYSREDSSGHRLVCIHHFSLNTIRKYFLPFPDKTHDPIWQKMIAIRQIFSSDDKNFGGSGIANDTILINHSATGEVTGITFDLPPQAALVLDPQYR